jgi:hypothetical protein
MTPSCARMLAELRIHEETEAFTIGTFENAMISSLRGPVTIAPMVAAAEIHERLVKSHPNGFAIITLVSEGVPLTVPTEARELAAQILKQYGSYYSCICDVVLGRGFRFATVRAVTASIRLVARSSCPSKVVGDVDACASWVAPLMAQAHADGRVSRDALQRAALRFSRGTD